MSTLYWNPQVTDFNPTADDDVVFSWGTRTFPSITAKSITVEGGCSITVGTFTVASLTINNGAHFKSTDTQDITCDKVDIQGGASVDIYGKVTAGTYAIGNGVKVEMHGGLTVEEFSFGGGFDLTVDGHFEVGGKVITDCGDVSWIWDVDIHFGSHIHHNHDCDPCYLAGTKILTLKGWVNVENLKVGDAVTVYNADGVVTTTPIVWVGKGHTRATTSHRIDDRNGYPVRVRKGAIADGVPSTDLLVTPEHMLCIEDVFVPVRCLVNDVSIIYEASIPEYDYYHFATASHSVVNANGVLSESYLGGPHQWEETDIHQAVMEIVFSAARPIVTNTAFLTKIRNNIAARCEDIPRDKNAIPSNEVFSIKLVDTSGNAIHALRSKDNTHVFLIPNNVEPIFHLDVPVLRPVDVLGPVIDDRRYLGARVDMSFIGHDGVVSPLVVDYTEDQSWHPDGWSKSGSRVILPVEARMLSVKVIEYVWDMIH